MRNSVFTIAAALALVGCGNSSPESDANAHSVGSPAPVGGNPSQMKLADIDLFNMSETHEIAKKLPPADAPLFLEYVINWKASQVSGDQSKVLKPDGTTPVTIAEATALTKAMLAKNAGGQ